MRIVSEANHVPASQKYCDTFVIDPNSGDIWVYDCAGTFFLLPSGGVAGSWTIDDGTTSQVINDGNTLNVISSLLVNGIVSATDTLTLGLDITGAVNGQVIKMVAGVPTWAADSTGLTQLREDFTGLVAGNVVNIAVAPAGNQTEVYRNGVLQIDPDDYSIAGTTVTFVTAFAPTESVSVIYWT